MRSIIILFILLNAHAQENAPSVSPQPQPSVPPDLTATQDPSSENAEGTESILNLRDPFKRPEIVSAEFKPKTELESFPVHDFQLLGVVTGPKHLRAIIQGPNGKTYFVKKGDPIGVRKGVIDKVTYDRLVVQEKIINVLGQTEDVVTELKIDSERKPTGGDRNQKGSSGGSQ